MKKQIRNEHPKINNREALELLLTGSRLPDEPIELREGRLAFAVYGFSSGEFIMASQILRMVEDGRLRHEAGHYVLNEKGAHPAAE